MRFSTVALALGLSAASAQRLDKPALWPNLDFGGPVLAGLPVPSHQIFYWSLGDMSGGCYERIKADGKDAKNFKQYSVKIEDCGQTWRICQENGAPKSIEEVARNFAKLPVRMRQWVQEVINYKDGGGAYAYGGLTVYFGSTVDTGVMFHETTHTVDFGGGFFSMRSTSQEWTDAYNLDTHVPDSYCQNNQQENLAAFPGLIIVDRFTNGQLVRDKPEIWRIGNQIQKVADQGDWNSPYGGRLLDWHGKGHTCTRRYKEHDILYPRTGEVSTNARIAAEGDPIFPVEDLTGIEIMERPVAESLVATNCTVSVE